MSLHRLTGILLGALLLVTGAGALPSAADDSAPAAPIAPSSDQVQTEEELPADPDPAEEVDPAQADVG